MRAGRLLVIGLIAVMAGCSDSTGPEDQPDDNPGVVTPNPKLTSLSGWVIDATMWVVPSLVDPAERGKLESSIRALSGHLAASNVVQINKDIEMIRGFINAGTIAEYVELGPIEVAMSTIESAIAE